MGDLCLCLPSPNPSCMYTWQRRVPLNVASFLTFHTLQSISHSYESRLISKEAATVPSCYLFSNIIDDNQLGTIVPALIIGHSPGTLLQREIITFPIKVLPLCVVRATREHWLNKRESVNSNWNLDLFNIQSL